MTTSQPLDITEMWPPPSTDNESNFDEGAESVEYMSSYLVKLLDYVTFAALFGLIVTAISLFGPTLFRVRPPADNTALIAQLNHEIGEQRGEIEALTRDNDELHQAQIGRDSEIAELRQQIDQNRSEIAALHRMQDTFQIRLWGVEADEKGTDAKILQLKK